MNRLTHSKGFTLIEIMIALIIIAVGMLGIAKLQGLALSNTGVARMRSLAAIEATSLASAMHANRGYWAAATAPTFTTAGTVATATVGALPEPTQLGTCVQASGVAPAPACTNAQIAGADVYTWLYYLNQALPNPTANVTCTTTVIPVACTITLQWTESMVGANAQEAQVAAANATGSIPANTTQAITHPTYELYVVP